METTNPNSPWYPYVWVDPERMSGTPCFRNTRLPVQSLFDHLAHNYSVDEFIDAFEGVSREMVLGTLQVAASEADKSVLASMTKDASRVKVVLDHCVPKPFGFLLVGHWVRTAHRMGWHNLQNGKLLAAASAEFQAMITVDKSIEFQQNLPLLPMPVLMLIAPSNAVEDLAPLVPQVLAHLAMPLENRLYIIRRIPNASPPGS